MVDIAGWLRILNQKKDEYEAWDQGVQQQTSAALPFVDVEVPTGPPTFQVGPLSVPNPLQWQGQGWTRQAAQYHAIMDPVVANVTQPALGAAVYAAGRFPSTPKVNWRIDGSGVSVQPEWQTMLEHRKVQSEEPEVPLQGANFGEYWRQNVLGGGPLARWAGAVVQDPTSYLGALAQRPATFVKSLPGAVKVPGLVRGAEGVLTADQMYQRVMGEMVDGAVTGAKGIASTLPIAERFSRPALAGEVRRFGYRLENALKDNRVASQLVDLATGNQLGLAGTALDWRTIIGPAWGAIDRQIAGIGHPLKQAELLQARHTALERENLLEAEFEQTRMALKESLAGGSINEREYSREMTDAWQRQARSVRSLQMELEGAIKDVGGIAHDEWATVGDADVLTHGLTTAGQRASDLARHAKDMGTAILGGRSGDDLVDSLFDLNDPQLDILAHQAQDPFYRQARTDAMQGMKQAFVPVLERYKDLIEPEDLASLRDTIAGSMQRVQEQNRPFTRGVGEALAGVGKSNRDTILSVWETDNKVSLPNAVRSVLSARQKVQTAVSDSLNSWYREHGVLDAAQRAQRIQAVTSSSKRLLREPALLAPENRGVKQIVEETVKRFPGGDVLNPDHLGTVAAAQVERAFGRASGLKDDAPWWGAYRTTTSALAELGVMSGRFLEQNFATILALSEAHGVPASFVLDLARQRLPGVARAMRRGEPINDLFDASVAPGYAAVRGAGDGTVGLPSGITGRAGGMLDIPGVEKSQTALGKLHPAVRAIPGALMGHGYWSANEDDPDRLRNTLLVGGLGLGAGAIAPRAARAVKDVSAAEESVGRAAAFYTVVEPELAARADRLHDAIDDIVAGKETSSVGKPMTRSDKFAGMNTIETMADLEPFLARPRNGAQPPPPTRAERDALLKRSPGSPEPPPDAGGLPPIAPIPPAGPNGSAPGGLPLSPLDPEPVDPNGMRVRRIVPAAFEGAPQPPIGAKPAAPAAPAATPSAPAGPTPAYQQTVTDYVNSPPPAMGGQSNPIRIQDAEGQRLNAVREAARKKIPSRNQSFMGDPYGEQPPPDRSELKPAERRAIEAHDAAEQALFAHSQAMVPMRRIIEHKGQVMAALERGDPVPPEVLAAYPDLAAGERPTTMDVAEVADRWRTLPPDAGPGDQPPAPEAPPPAAPLTPQFAADAHPPGSSSYETARMHPEIRAMQAQVEQLWDDFIAAGGDKAKRPAAAMKIADQRAALVQRMVARTQERAAEAAAAPAATAPTGPRPTTVYAARMHLERVEDPAARGLIDSIQDMHPEDFDDFALMVDAVHMLDPGISLQPTYSSVSEAATYQNLATLRRLAASEPAGKAAQVLAKVEGTPAAAGPAPGGLPRIGPEPATPALPSGAPPLGEPVADLSPAAAQRRLTQLRDQADAAVADHPDLAKQDAVITKAEATHAAAQKRMSTYEGDKSKANPDYMKLVRREKATHAALGAAQQRRATLAHTLAYEEFKRLEAQGETAPAPEAEPAQPMPPEPAAAAATSAPTGFTTSQGSTYTVERRPDYSVGTTRTKAPHVGHDPADVGAKPTSEHTVFISPEDAEEIGMWQTASNEDKLIQIDGGSFGLTSVNPMTGKRGLDGPIRKIVSGTPQVGLSPLELWRRVDTGPFNPMRAQFKGSHPGSPITSLDTGGAPAAPPTPGPAAGGLPPVSSAAAAGAGSPPPAPVGTAPLPGGLPPVTPEAAAPTAPPTAGDVYSRLYAKHQAGDVTDGGQPSPHLQVARKIEDNGVPLTPDLFKQLVNDVQLLLDQGGRLGRGNAYQNALQSLVQAWVTAGGPPAGGVVDAMRAAGVAGHGVPPPTAGGLPPVTGAGAVGLPPAPAAGNGAPALVGPPATGVPPLGSGQPPALPPRPPGPPPPGEPSEWEPFRQKPALLGVHTTAASPVARGGNDVDTTAIKRAFKQVGGRMSSDTLEQIALDQGARPEQAAALRAAWEEEITQAEGVAKKKVDDINFDYTDVSEGIEDLRKSGVFPFITWPSKAIPLYTKLLLQNPRWWVALDAMFDLSDQEIEEAGLTSRFTRLIKMGDVGDYLAEHVLGRKGTLLGNPLATVLPYAEMGRGALGPTATPADQALNLLGPLGLSPGPIATIPMQMLGMTSELPADMMRTSAYLRGASTMLTGRETDPERITKQVVRAARGVSGAPVEPTVDGSVDFLKDRAIRQRIAEIAVEETGKPASGNTNQYRAAMDDPDSPIWQRAQREVERQRAGEQIGTSPFMPFRTKFLSDTEAQLRPRQVAAGVSGPQIGALAAQPATARELATAQAQLRQRPLRPGETLEERVVSTRLSTQFSAASKRDPLSMGLATLGGQEKDVLNRQRDAYFAYATKVRRMAPNRRAPLLNAYLADKPILRRWLAENQSF